MVCPRTRPVKFVLVVLVFLCVSDSIVTEDSLPGEWDSQLGSEMTLQLFKLFEKKIEKLEKSEKTLRASIGTLISTNVQLRIEMEEMTNRYTDLEKRLTDISIDLLSRIESVKDTKTGEKGEFQGESQEICEKLIKSNREEDTNIDAYEDNDDDDHTQKKEKRSPDSTHPAFTAYLNKMFSPSPKDSTVVYDKVLLNEGENYDEITGLFTTTTSGVYLFSWSASVNKNRDNNRKNKPPVTLRLMVNDKHVVSVVSSGCNEIEGYQGSSVAVIKLTRGDVVWISVDKTSEPSDVIMNVNDDRRTTSFTGVLLHREEE